MSEKVQNIYAAPQAHFMEPIGGNSSGLGKGHPIPPEVPGWSWGAFFMSWIWAIGNRTWIGLLALVPYLGFVIAIILGVKGREWAWQNKRWDDIEHFNRVQRRWSIWGACLVLIPVTGIMAALLIPLYYGYGPSTPDIRLEMALERMTKHVGAHIITKKPLPATIEDAGYKEGLPEGVRSIVVNQQTAQLEITMEKTPMSGQTFYMAPAWDKDGYIVWRCLHGDIQKKLLPTACRYSAAEPFSL